MNLNFILVMNIIEIRTEIDTRTGTQTDAVMTEIGIVTGRETMIEIEIGTGTETATGEEIGTGSTMGWKSLIAMNGNEERRSVMRRERKGRASLSVR